MVWLLYVLGGNNHLLVCRHAVKKDLWFNFMEIKMKKNLLIVFLCVFTFGLNAGAVSDHNCLDTFTFAVIGDRAGGERSGYFENKVVKTLNLLSPSFVLNVGDNIGGYSEDVNKVNKQWDSFEKSLNGLRMPFYRVAGNHDVTNAAMAKIYQERYGNPYFYKIYNNVLFLFVDTEDPFAQEPPEVRKQQDAEMAALRAKIKVEGYTEDNIRKLDDYEVRCNNLRGGKITDGQVEYFKKVLKANKNVRWTFVIIHKPIYNETNPPANWLKIEKMLEKRPYTVFAGHTHRNAYTLRNGRDYITLATAGGGDCGYPKTSTGVYDHVLLVNMTDNGPAITNILMEAIFDKADVQAVRVEDYSVSSK